MAAATVRAYERVTGGEIRKARVRVRNPSNRRRYTMRCEQPDFMTVECRSGRYLVEISY
jgi:hypothetical protein